MKQRIVTDTFYNTSTHASATSAAAHATTATATAHVQSHAAHADILAEGARFPNVEGGGV